MDLVKGSITKVVFHVRKPSHALKAGVGDAPKTIVWIPERIEWSPELLVEVADGALEELSFLAMTRYLTHFRDRYPDCEMVASASSEDVITLHIFVWNEADEVRRKATREGKQTPFVDNKPPGTRIEQIAVSGQVIPTSSFVPLVAAFTAQIDRKTAILSANGDTLYMVYQPHDLHTRITEIREARKRIPESAVDERTLRREAMQKVQKTKEVKQLRSKKDVHTTVDTPVEVAQQRWEIV